MISANTSVTTSIVTPAIFANVALLIVARLSDDDNVLKIGNAFAPISGSLQKSPLVGAVGELQMHTQSQSDQENSLCVQIICAFGAKGVNGGSIASGDDAISHAFKPDPTPKVGGCRILSAR